MRRLKTLRRPPIYPKTPGHLPCSSLTHPLPLPSRRPSVSFGGFGLRAHGIDTLLIMGFATSGVVLSTLRYAADADYQLVVEDCCADHSAEVHAMLMEKIFPSQATVVSSEDVLAALSRE